MTAGLNLVFFCDNTVGNIWCGVNAKFCSFTALTFSYSTFNQELLFCFLFAQNVIWNTLVWNEMRWGRDRRYMMERSDQSHILPLKTFRSTSEMEDIKNSKYLEPLLHFTCQYKSPHPHGFQTSFFNWEGIWQQEHKQKRLQIFATC